MRATKSRTGLLLMTCLALASWDLDEVITAQPRVALAMLRELARRLRDVTDAHRH